MTFSAPDVGVCKVIGMSKTHKNDHYGNSVRSLFTEIGTLLDEVYGPGVLIDHVNEGALDLPQFWVMEIHNKERVYGKGYAKDLPKGLTAIFLEVVAKDLISARIELTYEFENMEDCRSHMNRGQTNGL